MSTRGSITFVIDSQEKTAYNHHDSYPEVLGDTVFSWLIGAETDMDALRQAVRELRVVTPGSSPTTADIERVRQHDDIRVPERTPEDWYGLLAETQGKPDLILLAGIVEDVSDFPLNSVACEWGYVVDLDADTFEVYRGHQDEPHEAGRFAARANPEIGCYPIALVASWPLADLPHHDAFLAQSRA